MNFPQFLLVLRARLKLILSILIVTVIVVLLVSLLLPKTYKASTTVVLNYKGSDPVTGLTLPSQLMPGYMATQVDIINSMNVALLVVDQLNLTESPEAKQQFDATFNGKGTIREWKAEQLLRKLEVIPSRESSVLNINFRSKDPKFAADVANAFANAYQHISVQLKVDPSKKAALYFNDQIKQLGDNFENAQRKLSKYQQENGIINADTHLDVETVRLNELSSQLVNIQGQLMEALSRQNQVQGDKAAESPDVMANPIIQNLKLQLAQANLKLSALSQRFTESHPQYQAAKAEVDILGTDLQAQIKATANSIGNNTQILRRREADLRTALAAQKIKVLEFNRKRDELKFLSKEMESAQRSYEAASQRFMQTNFEGQSNLIDIAVLNPALPPISAATPKLLLNVLLSVFLGTLTGVCCAMVFELLDRRVRSEYDLVKGLNGPVLGVFQRGDSRRLSLPTLLLPN